MTTWITKKTNKEERYTVTQGHKNYKNKFKFA